MSIFPIGFEEFLPFRQRRYGVKYFFVPHRLTRSGSSRPVGVAKIDF